MPRLSQVHRSSFPEMILTEVAGLDLSDLNEPAAEGGACAASLCLPTRLYLISNGLDLHIRRRYRYCSFYILAVFTEAGTAGFSAYFFDHRSYIFCARFVRHPGPQGLNGDSRFLRRWVPSDMYFRPTLSLLKNSKIKILQTSRLVLPLVPQRTRFLTWGCF